MTKIPRLLATMTHDLVDEDQLVVHNAAGEKLVVLNQIGAAIYFLIDGERTSADIARFLKETLPSPTPDSCEQDVEAFLDVLSSHGIVMIEEKQTSPANGH